MPARPPEPRIFAIARRGELALAEADSRLWESVIRDVAEADRQALTSIDFWLPR